MTMLTLTMVSPSTPVVLALTIKALSTLGTLIKEMLSHYFKSPMVSMSTVGDIAPLLAYKDVFDKHLS